MGKIYELTREDIDDIITDVIKNNKDIKEYCDKDGQVKEALESIFYDDDINNVEDVYQQYEQQYYGTGKKASFYFRDTDKHICARDIVVDFIKIIFSTEIWNTIKKIYCEAKGIKGTSLDVSEIIYLIAKIKETISKNIIKLEEDKLCFYLEIITHFREHKTVEVDEILEWLPKAAEECAWNLTVSECKYRRNMHCQLKCEENYCEIVQNKLNEMVESRVLMKNIGHEDQYKINY